MALLKGPWVSGKVYIKDPVTFAGAVNISAAITPGKAIDFSGLTPAAITTGSLIGTGSTWVAHSTANSCGMKLLLSYTAATGEFASLRIRARSNSVAPVVTGNFAASAGQNDHGNLYAVQGYAQPLTYTQSDASNIVNAIYGCVQRSAGGTSVGRDWTGWLDTHMAVKASGGSYLLRMSHNGSVANDGLITIYGGGRIPYFFNLEDSNPGFYTATGTPGSTAAGYLAVNTPEGVKYIALLTA